MKGLLKSHIPLQSVHIYLPFIYVPPLFMPSPQPQKSRKTITDGGSISDKGTVELANAMKTHANLQVFYLRGDNISDVGAQALAEMIKAKANLSAFYLCIAFFVCFKKSENSRGEYYRCWGQ